MATVDRTSGDWYLKALDGNIYLDARAGHGTVSIAGDLIVIGSQTNIGSVETLITDNIITLAANVTTGVPVLNAGIEVRRGDEPNAVFQWTEAVGKWQISSDGGLTLSDVMSHVADDPTPYLGGDLNLAGYEIRSANSQNIVFNPGYSLFGSNAGIQIKYTINSVPQVTDSTVFYASLPGGGVTGLYVSNSIKDDQELITKQRALIYSLVL